MTRDDITWLVIPTEHDCCIEVSARMVDLLPIPDSSMGVLASQVCALAKTAHENGMKADNDCVSIFIKTTTTVTVCLRPVQIMVTPRVNWQPPTDAIN